MKRENGMSVFQIGSFIFLGIVGFLILSFKTVQKKQLRRHHLNVQKLVERISFEKVMREQRFWYLNLYDFLRYNLKEALRN
jgi:hypothetical protein